MDRKRAFSLWRSGVITREQVDDLVTELYQDWVRAKEVSDAKTEDVPKVEQTEFPQRHEDSRKESEG